MYSDIYEKILPANGFTREVAGDDDFNAVLNAIKVMRETGKGLLVSGCCGVGKTVLVNALTANMATVFRVNLGMAIELRRFDKDWQDYYSVKPCTMSVILDDFGAELPKNEYGVKYEAVGDFIAEWHAKHDAGRRMFITTNLTPKEIDERYGGRILSRLKDLCVPLRLNGQDKRKWNF